jgi:5'-nucleotidase
VRTDLVPGPDGAITFGQLFEAQPFGNNWIVKSMTGRQIRALLEQQFESGSNTVARPIMLMPSAGVTYSYDLTRAPGQRILDLRLNGAAIADERVYRVAANSFLAAGGDNFTVFREGTDAFQGPVDIEALERYMSPSWTTYSLPSERILPASLAPASPPKRMKSS